VPAGTPGSAGAGSYAVVEYGSGPSPRTGALSATACDFANGLPLYHSSGSLAAFLNSPIPITKMTISPTQKSGDAVLVPGTTYYLNIKNGVGATCGASSCDILINFQKPL
jgi:hypothetical protein